MRSLDKILGPHCTQRPKTPVTVQSDAKADKSQPNKPSRFELKNGITKQSQNLMNYWGFHAQLIALLSHASTHGVLLVSGLQQEHVYFIFFRCTSTTEATVLSSRSTNIDSN